MIHFSRAPKTLFSILSTIVLGFGLTAVQAQAPAGPRAPASVPKGYVITPFGYFHPSCVKHLAEGDILREDEQAIEHKDGSFDSMPACEHPHFEADGKRVAADGTDDDLPKIGHDWIEESSTTTSTSFGELTGTWKVPPGPTTNHGQTDYFFPGLEDFKKVVTILQPVLGWDADFIDAWGIASWNCCEKGTTYESSAVPVNTGDTIYGSMKDTCKAGTLECSDWNVVTKDETSGKSTSLEKTSNFKQTFNWAFGGVLEVYNVAKCGDYPSNGSIEFTSLALYNDSFDKFSKPNFAFENLAGKLNPQCKYNGKTTETAVTLDY
jgi:hypothetical protein